MFTSIFHDDLIEDQANDRNSNSSVSLCENDRIDRVNSQNYTHSEISSQINPQYSANRANKCTVSDSYISPDTYSAYDCNYETCKGTSEVFDASNDSLKALSLIISDHKNFNVKKFREELDNITNCCISEVLKKKDTLSTLSEKHTSTKYAEYFSKRIQNLNAQQNEFEKFGSFIKTQLTISNVRNSSFDAELVTKSLQKEIAIFKQFFPAYGIKQEILNKFTNNHVTVISANCLYSLNIALPFILSNVCQHHTFIACEGNETKSRILLENINSVLSNEDRESLGMKLCVLSEEQLLKRFSFSTLFAQADSCIILNIPVKRSVIVDILLSNLRDLLNARSNSKLVLLLTPGEDVSRFVNYFSPKSTVSVLQLPDISLPVKTVWKEALLSLDDDFIDDVVKTVFAVHAVCEAGDIIVFLPSFEDIQIAYEKLSAKTHYYQFNDIFFFCINDCGMDLFVQGKNMSSGRRVFLFTTGYEGIRISSVRYVVDCGIKKELIFDSDIDNDIIAPAFISRQMARARAQLAGISNVGTCFKLYNKVNWSMMNRKEHAEIFCVNPLYSLLKFLQYCPQKTRSIQLVEALPDNIMDSTLTLLQAYRAIDKDLQVTPSGEELCKIPLSMKYSQLILFGLKSGFAYEAVILVSFFSIKSTLFVESVDEHHQKSIDMVKFNFNQQDSDTLTFLNIFKQWKENRFRKVWCTNNLLNFSTLKSIRYKVDDICNIISDSLGVEINQQFSEACDQQSLIQMLFECFYNNLCVYMGHPKIGYQVLSSKQLVLIHSSSFISLHKNYSDFVIYDDIVLGDPPYIVNLTSIPFDFVMDYLQKNILNFDSSDLFDHKLMKREKVVGEKIISQVLLKNEGKKLKEVEDAIKKETYAEVVLIEPDLEKGCVTIYAFPDDVENCLVSLNDILEKHIKAMTNEEETKLIPFKKGPNTVYFEIKWVKGAESVSAVHVLPSLKSSSAENKVPSYAADLLEEFVPRSSINYSLKLCWPRRMCTGEGYLNLENRSDFDKARKLSHKHISVGECEVFVLVHDTRAYQLLLSEIPYYLTKEAIFNSFSKILPYPFKVELCYKAPFETFNSELEKMKQQIETNVKLYTNIDKFQVQISKPKPSSKYMIAYVNVFEERCLQTEAENVSRTLVNDMPLSCEELYSTDISCSAEVYRALKYTIKEELEIFICKGNGTLRVKNSYDLVDHDDGTTIKLFSNEIKAIKSLQLRINHLLDGIKLHSTNQRNIHKLFCHGGHVFLKALERVNDVYIVTNYERKAIRLYGFEKNCNYVRMCIYDFLEDAENEVAKDIILSSGKQSRVILKTIIKQYGANLEKFIELCSLRSAALNIKTSCLSLYGKKESIEKAEECIRELSEASDLSDICSNISSEECPLCFSPPGSSTAVRLQHCSHLYCSHDCVKTLIEEAEFPKKCCEKDCSKPVLLQDIKSILNDDIEEINKLAERSLKAYLDKNSDKIFYCPAPDCSMFVYKTEVIDNKWHCPLCKNFICIGCNVVYHEGLSCDMYKGSKEDPDYSFKVYQKTNMQCKQCPLCKTAIEKRSGCNRMTCSSCRTNFCWICLKHFSNVFAAYDHIDQAHRGQLFVP